MRTNQTIVNLMPDIESQELDFISHLTAKLDDQEAEAFFTRYRVRRRKSDNVLLFTILGLIIVAGVQRFYLKQILMGFLYLFTAGFCLVGTILDIINHKQLTFEYNEELALDILDDIRYR
jgi:TM2 domain-containing membrane protein YozV